MRDPRAMQEWANLDDFGLQLPPDMVPTIDPVIELGILLEAEMSAPAATVAAKPVAAEEAPHPQIAKKNTAA